MFRFCQPLELLIVTGLGEEWERQTEFVTLQILPVIWETLHQRKKKSQPEYKLNW